MRTSRLLKCPYCGSEDVKVKGIEHHMTCSEGHEFKKEE